MSEKSLKSLLQTCISIKLALFAESIEPSLLLDGLASALSTSTPSLPVIREALHLISWVQVVYVPVQQASPAYTVCKDKIDMNPE